MTVVATAGHVDHGKSSLVLALTGTDPDRLAEEKRRGLTIDLGFAHMTLPSGRRPQLRRRAGPRAVPAQHARRRRRHRRLRVRRRRDRRLEAAVGGAPADPRAARAASTGSIAVDEDRPRRRRPAGTRAPRRRRARRRDVPRDAADGRGVGDDRRAGSTSCVTRSTTWCRTPAPPPIAVGRGCGSTASSPPREAARW